MFLLIILGLSLMYFYKKSTTRAFSSLTELREILELKSKRKKEISSKEKLNAVDEKELSEISESMKKINSYINLSSRLIPKAKKSIQFSNLIISTLLIVLTLTFFDYLFWFSENVYNHIPASVGGGLTTKIKFILKKDSNVNLKRDTDSQTITAPYKLVADMNDSYTFIEEDNANTIYILPKSAFEGYFVVE